MNVTLGKGNFYLLCRCRGAIGNIVSLNVVVHGMVIALAMVLYHINK